MQKLTKWNALLVLSAAQFLMVLDSTVMNVAISQLVVDLDTDIAQIQAAITLYALVMAALMLVGAKLGDIMGRKRAFVVGSIIYAVGSGITSLAPNVAVLMLGWSFIEGFGAVLILPAMAALIAGNYTGKNRAVAYAVLGGVAGLGAAAGPMIGGFATTYLSWRVVFAGEVLVAGAMVLGSRVISDAPVDGPRPRLDIIGAVLSGVGLASIVFGVLKASEWGWILPNDSPVEPFGLSLTPVLVTFGFVILGVLWMWLERQETRGGVTLFSPALLRIQAMTSGLSMMLVQNLIMAGVLFTVPLFLQVVVGYDAFRTGVALLPFSLAVMATAIVGPRLAERVAPRHIVQAGMGLMLAGSLLMLGTVDIELDSVGLGIALALVGGGIGLLASQLGNVVQSSVGGAARGEAGGLQYTSANLGASLGTALIGGILLTGLLGGFSDSIANDPRISDEIEGQVGVAIAGGVPFVPSDDVKTAATNAGISPAEIDAIVSDYEASQVDALRITFAAIAALVVIGSWFTRKLPLEKLGEPAGAAEPTAS